MDELHPPGRQGNPRFGSPNGPFGQTGIERKAHMNVTGNVYILDFHAERDTRQPLPHKF